MAELNPVLRHSGAYVAELARRIGLPGFWRWWSAELAPLVPVPARVAVARHRLRPVLAFEGDTAVLWRPSTQGQPLGLVEAARIPLTGDANATAAAGRSAFAALSPMAYGGAVAAPRIVLALAPAQVLRRVLTLPAAVEENLRAALGYDLDRLTPFKADELYFDAAITGRDPAKGEIRVDFVAARRTVVDQALAIARGFGVEVAAVVPVAPQVAAASRLNLVPDPLRRSSSVFARWQFWLPLAVLGAFAATAVILPLWQKRDYAMTVMKQAEQARGHAMESDRLRGELDRQVADYNFALGRKYAFPGSAQVLDEMSRLLPDDTWLTQLEIKTVARGKEPSRELLMRGESLNAGKLISLLEEAKLVGQAAPRSPTTKVQPGPGEVFDLGAQLKALPPPAPVALGGILPAPATTGAVGEPAPAAAAAAPSVSVVAPPSPSPVTPVVTGAPPPPAAPTADAAPAAPETAMAPPAAPAAEPAPERPPRERARGRRQAATAAQDPSAGSQPSPTMPGSSQ